MSNRNRADRRHHNYPQMSYVSQDGVRWAFQQPVQTTLQRTVLLAIAKHANPEGEAWPPIGTLCSLALVTRRSIDRAIGQLADLGILQVNKENYGLPIYRLVGFGVAFEQPKVVNSTPVFQPGRVDSNDRGLDSNDSPKATKSAEVWTLCPSVWTQSPSVWTQTTSPYLLVAKDSNKTPIRLQEGERFSASAAPPPPPPAPVSDKRPASQPRRTSTSPAKPTQADHRSPRPDELVKIYNERIAGTRIVPIGRALSRREAIMLTQAVKHPAIAGQPDAWARYCGWAATDPHLRGERAGGYPASLSQLCRAATIDTWAAEAVTPSRAMQTAIPACLLDPNYCPPPDTPSAPEASDPNRRWNPGTRTWDYVYPPGFLEAVAEITVTGPLPDGYTIESRCTPLPGPPRGSPEKGKSRDRRG